MQYVTSTFSDATCYTDEKTLHLNYNRAFCANSQTDNLKTALCGVEDSASFSDL